MKSFEEYINESIKDLPKDVYGIIVFDIDDTLLRVDTSLIAVHKRMPDGSEKRLSTEEFAKDPDTADPSKQHLFDFREARDPERVYRSIMQGTPIIKNLRIMDSYVAAGYDFCFLTARACEDVIKDALDKFLQRRTKTGVLQKLGSIFKKSLSHAINDVNKEYEGDTDAEKKANILRELCDQYDRVVFVDDDMKNVRAARNLGIENLCVIKAWK